MHHGRCSQSSIQVNLPEIIKRISMHGAPSKPSQPRVPAFQPVALLRSAVWRDVAKIYGVLLDHLGRAFNIQTLMLRGWGEAWESAFGSGSL